MKELDVASLAQRVDLTDGVLVLRNKAAEMFELSKADAGLLTYGDVLICNLAGITDCSSSFVDEFILGWQRRIRELENTMMVLKNLCDDVRYTIESTLSISKDHLVLIFWNVDHYEILGNKIEKNVLETFSLMTDGAKITVRTIADSLGIELNSAGNRLKKLFDAHIAMRQEQGPEMGGKFEYFLPKL